MLVDQAAYNCDDYKGTFELNGVIIGTFRRISRKRAPKAFYDPGAEGCGYFNMESTYFAVLLDVILLFNYFKSVSAIVTHGDK
jgi:hypothetical protein